MGGRHVYEIAPFDLRSAILDLPKGGVCNLDFRAPLTYNAQDMYLGGVTYGGYSNSIVVDEAFVLRVSEKLNIVGAAPLLCAGITTYSPLRHWNVGKGQKVGVVGLGGLGHMGVQFAKAFGADVVLFTTSPNKIADALRVGA